VMRRAPLDSSGLFSELVRHQLQSDEGVSSKITCPDPENETKADSILARSDMVSTLPGQKKVPRMTSLESPTKPLSFNPVANPRALPDATSGKIDEPRGKTAEPPLLVATVEPASEANGSIRLGSLAIGAESSTKTGPLEEVHHLPRIARATLRVGSSVASPVEGSDLRNKTDETKIGARSHVTVAGISNTASMEASFPRTAFRGSSETDAQLDSEASSPVNGWQTSPGQMHGSVFVNESVVDKPALTAAEAEKNSNAPEIVSSGTIICPPRDIVGNTTRHSAPHLKGAAVSVQRAIAGGSLTDTSVVTESGAAKATIASADPAQCNTVLLPVSRAPFATTKRPAAPRISLQIGQTRSSHAPGKNGSESLDGEPTAARSMVLSDRPGSSPHAVALSHGAMAAGRSVALNKVTGPEIPVPVSSSPARNSGPDLINSGALSQTQPSHPASGTTTMQQASHGVHSLRASSSATFDRMDAAVEPQVIESAPQRLAVGVHNAGLGWVEIRTNGASGQVSATLVSGSAETHSAISAQLPPMQEYLASEHVHIDTLASERFSPSSGGGENSSRDQSQNGAGTQTKSTVQESSLLGFPTEVDAEGLSYINVRV
jgi:hypothetical protein